MEDFYVLEYNNTTGDDISYDTNSYESKGNEDDDLLGAIILVMSVLGPIGFILLLPGLLCTLLARVVEVKITTNKKDKNGGKK